MFKPRTETLLSLGLGLLLALLIHAPLLEALGDVLPGQSASDVYRAHWSVWLVAEEFPGWPYSTDLIAFPEGASLLPFPAVSLLLLSPFTWIFGPDISLPLLVLAYTILAFSGTWYLVRTLGGGIGGAALAGALFATQPILSGNLFDGTIEMLAVGWLPLFFAAMYRAVMGEGRWGVWAGSLFLLICLESVYLGSFAALGALVFLTRLRSMEGIRAAGFSAITVLVGVGVLSVLFWPILSGIDKNLDSSKDDALQVTLKTVSVLPSCLSVEKKFLQEVQEERLVVENLCEDALEVTLEKGEKAGEESAWSVASRQTKSVSIESSSPQTQHYVWRFADTNKQGEFRLRFVRPDIRPANAASASGLWFLAKYPGGRGWIVGDIYAPPMAHWLVFLVLGFAGLVRSKHNPMGNASWVIALGGLYLLLSIHSGVMSPWYDSPIGEVVRFPRRYLVGVTLCFSVAAGLGLAQLLRWPKVEMGLGMLLGVYLAWWGAVAGGLGQAYPLTPLPERPEFAAWIAKDRADAAVLLVPQQLPQESGINQDPNAPPAENRRECLPVFAQLGAMDKLFPCQTERSHIASSDQVWLQTQYEKASWYAPSLVTLAKRSTDVNLEKNLTDLARGKLGYFDGKNDFEDPWRFAKSESYASDMAWLKGAGLKYIAVDVARYRPQELAQIDKVLSPYAVEVDGEKKYMDFEDGTGVRVYRLYDKKPKIQAAPKKTFQDAAVTGFSGRVVDVVDKVQGVLSLRVQSEGQSTDCFIRPEDGSFHCRDAGKVEEVFLRINQSTFTTEMTQNKDGTWNIKPLKVIPQ